jgi:hypothetical protein
VHGEMLVFDRQHQIIHSPDIFAVTLVVTPQQHNRNENRKAYAVNEIGEKV